MRSRTGMAAALCGISLLTVGCTGDDPPPPRAPTPSTPADAQGPTPGAAGAGDPYYPYDGNGGYDARDYHVSVTYDPASGRLDGQTTVTATAGKDLSRFNLDLRGLEVSAVTVNGTPAEYAREGEFELVITPREPVARGGTFRTVVTYGGVPSSAGGEGFASGWERADSGASYVLGQPHSAAFWYPVNGTPRDKATFHLDARVPQGWSAISIGRHTGVTTADGWDTWSWAEPTPVASYLTTIAVNRFSIDRGTLPDGTPVLSAYAPGSQATRVRNEQVGEVIEFLAGWFGPYPQSAAGGIYLDSYVGFSLETQSRPTYTAGARLSTVVHELAHQWYGNSVTVASWSDICLNECLASYATWLWAEGTEGANLDASYREEVDRRRGDTDFWADKLHEMGAGNEFDGVYGKGALAIHALRRLIGEEAFGRVLREWPAAHRDGNASWPEFERFVAERAGRDLSGFFDAWFRGTTIPADEHLYPGSLRR